MRLHPLVSRPGLLCEIRYGLGQDIHEQMYKAQDRIRAHHVYQLIEVVLFERYAEGQCRVPWRENGVNGDYVEHADLEKVLNHLVIFHNFTTDCEGGRSADLVQK